MHLGENVATRRAWLVTADNIFLKGGKYLGTHDYVYVNYRVNGLKAKGINNINKSRLVFNCTSPAADYFGSLLHSDAE